MTMRFILVFNSCKQGWTETWYNSGAFSIPAAKSIGSALATKRQALCGRGCFIEGFRVSPVVAGVASNIGLVVPGIIPGRGFRVPEADVLANLEGLEEPAWLCHAAGQTSRKRQVWLRGVKDDWIRRLPANNCAFEVPAELEDAFNNFKAFILATGATTWQIQRVNNDVGVSPIRNIVDIGLDATNSYYLITTDVNHGFTPGQKVRIKGAKGENVQRALGYVQVRTTPTLNTFTINRVALTSPNPTYTGGGTARLLLYDYEPLSYFERIRVSKRNVGRALFVRRGRRKGKR